MNPRTQGSRDPAQERAHRVPRRCGGSVAQPPEAVGGLRKVVSE